MFAHSMCPAGFIHIEAKVSRISILRQKNIGNAPNAEFCISALGAFCAIYIINENYARG